MALAFVIPSGDETVILDTRQMVVYPFTSPNWTDLRLGVYASVTALGNNNQVTGLAETITTTGTPIQDNYFIGLKTNNSNLPGTAGDAFVGWSSWYNLTGGGNIPLSSISPVQSPGNSYWSVIYNNNFVTWIGSGTSQSGSAQNNGLWLPQNIGGVTNGTFSGGMVFRFHRATGSSLALDTVTSANCNFINSQTPTVAEVRGWLRNPPTLQAIYGTPPTFVAVPNAFCAYWPFFNSKLRIHCVVIEKFA